ncbi:AAA family ATPase [Pseudomonas sp. CG7]|uniref:AAA family ATPase n=1 Tax=Pseudomonas sp. CG7 TaxID=191007 RepID=UPI0020336C7F|nr:AAA family ATPase [Pseudomonas sp. CG7]MCM2460291.1 AAA family ATPase [Pseudomonas sp. CG7]
MISIQRPDCPDFMVPYLADGPMEEHPFRTLFEEFSRNQRSLSRVFPFDRKKLFEHLMGLFHQKCAYCESKLGTATDGVIDQFRPRRLLEVKNSEMLNPYLYLMYDWRNLYLSCPTCNRNKGNRFPVMGGRGFTGVPYGYVVELESNLLLDPCLNDPDEELIFLPDGTVIGATARGQATVDLLILNRRGLVDARAEVARRFDYFSHKERLEYIENAEPYSAVFRHLLKAEGRRSPSGLVSVNVSNELNLPKSDISTEDGVGLEQYRAVAQFVVRLRIENFGPIHALDLDLSKSGSSNAPCFALLGENGVGKSTLLRALAMALSGQAYVERLRLKSNDCLAENAYRGEVRVTIDGQANDIVMSLQRNRKIIFNEEKSSSLVLAYGATRLLPRGRHKAKAGERHAKIDNLFDPFLPLTNPNAWLSSLDPARLVDVNSVLASLLPEEQQLQVIQQGDNVRVVVAGDPQRRIDELSDGYQSMLGMAVDIMQVLYLAYSSMESAEGVVLIDELGNHFHPAWRLRCVRALREAFPRTQFIFTSHDPLCLRGLYEGEVAVLMRDKLRRVYALEELPPIDRLRVDQILSSEHFGLRSTVDPEMEERVREYEALVESGSRTSEENLRLDELTSYLTDSRYLGGSRRERLALQLIDTQYMPDVPLESTVSAKKLSESTVAKLQHLMKEIQPSQGVKSTGDNTL